MHEFISIIIKCFSALFQLSLEFLCLRLYLSSFANILWKILGLRAFVAKSVDVAIYALYPESFCDENLAIRKVFAFSDSAIMLQ